MVAGLGAMGVAAASAPAPTYVGEIGALTVAVAMTAGLVARTGGRVLPYAAVAVALSALVVLTDEPVLRTGAAVMTCVVGAVFAVMVTVPSPTWLRAAREATIAVLVGCVAAVTVAGLEPTINLLRFEYASLVGAFVLCFLVVHRLGAGWHGLGRRGLVVVLLGGVVLALSLAYAEVLRRYGTPGLVDSLLDGRAWALEHLGGAPRPIQALLGVPALVWGTHLRARRRQGWWFCAFGVAATAPIAHTLLDPRLTVSQVALTTLYSLLVGIVVGGLLIRLDLTFNAGRGRRARVDDTLTTLRPEPPRTHPLL